MDPDAHENDDIGGEHVSRSPSHLLHEAKLVRPEEGRILYNEQKSLHIHLKAEFAKLFEVLKLSVFISCLPFLRSFNFLVVVVFGELYRCFDEQ